MRMESVIIGGMGSVATAMLFSNLIGMAEDKLHIVVDNDPFLPDRSEYDKLIKALQEKVDKYQDSTLIAIACNNAAYLIPKLKSKVPIADIIQITINAIPKAKSVVVLGGNVTYKEQTYKAGLEARGIKLIKHSEKIQKEVLDIIRKVKRRKKPKIDKLVKKINKQYKPDYIVLGCTELNYLGGNLINSNYELAKYIYESNNTSSR